MQDQARARQQGTTCWDSLSRRPRELARAENRLTDLGQAEEDEGDHRKRPAKTAGSSAEGSAAEAPPAASPVPCPAAGAMAPLPAPAPCSHGALARSGGTKCGLTQLAGGTVEAGGTDALSGDWVALLGGSGTLADLGTALAEGPWQAGCQERGHRQIRLAGAIPLLCPRLFFPFLFKARKPFMTVKVLCHPKSKETHMPMVP